MMLLLRSGHDCDCRRRLLIGGRCCRRAHHVGREQRVMVVRLVVVVVPLVVVQRVMQLQVRRGVMVVGVGGSRSRRAQVVAGIGRSYLLLDALVWVVDLLRNACLATRLLPVLLL